jgi:hypothetical protein
VNGNVERTLVGGCRGMGGTGEAVDRVSSEGIRGARIWYDWKNKVLQRWIGIRLVAIRIIPTSPFKSSVVIDIFHPP